jgi:hypothetical protein
MVEQSKLHELFLYDKETGNLYNKFTRNSRALKGAKAGYLVSYKGNKNNQSPLQYRYVRIDRKSYRMHRLIWIYVYGYIPENMDIDHVNGNGTDNRLENLRLVSRQENAKNRKITQNIKQGVFGVSFYEPLNKWRAMIKNNGKLEHIGYFEDKEEAIQARKNKEKEYGFHTNHGSRR